MRFEILCSSSSPWFSFMATAREQKSREEEGLRTAGKFADKRFFRKPPKKPYDRPPTTLRTSGNNSWILKLVDPAQRLISSGSQMLFSSVFRNFPHRLPSRISSPGFSFNFLMMFLWLGSGLFKDALAGVDFCDLRLFVAFQMFDFISQTS